MVLAHLAACLPGVHVRVKDHGPLQSYDAGVERATVPEVRPVRRRLMRLWPWHHHQWIGRWRWYDPTTDTHWFGPTAGLFCRCGKSGDL